MVDAIFIECLELFNRVENNVKTIQQGIVVYDIRFEQGTAGRKDNVTLKTQVHNIMVFQSIYANKLKAILNLDINTSLKEEIIRDIKNTNNMLGEYWNNAAKLLDHIADPHTSKEYFNLNTKYYEEYIKLNHKLIWGIGTYLSSKAKAA